MKSVYKFSMYPSDRRSVSMPRGAKVLSVAEQHGSVCMWALVDSSAPLTERRVRIAGTGHGIFDDEASWDFVGTVLADSGSLVLHFFVEPERSDDRPATSRTGG